MIYAGEFLVDFAKVFKFSSVSCGLYHFRKQVLHCKTLKLPLTLKFNFLYIVIGLLYRFERKSVFLTSLGDFSIDLMTRKFIEDTDCGNL